MTEFIAYYLVACAVAAIVVSTVHERSPEKIVRHSIDFFLKIVGGIFIFSVLVHLLELYFIG